MKKRIKDTEFVRSFFNGTPNFQQVNYVTIGKEYDILYAKPYGEVEDYTFIDDSGAEQTLASYFFEEVEK